MLRAQLSRNMDVVSSLRRQLTDAEQAFVDLKKRADADRTALDRHLRKYKDQAADAHTELDEAWRERDKALAERDKVLGECEAVREELVEARRVGILWKAEAERCRDSAGARPPVEFGQLKEEIAALRHDIAAGRQSEAAFLRKENATLREEAAALRQETALLRQEGAALRDRCNALCEEGAVLREEGAVLRKEGAVLREESVALRAESAAMRAETARLSGLITERDRRRAELKQMLANVSAQLKETKARLHAQRL